MMARAFDPIAHGKTMREGGFWHDRTIDEYFIEAIVRTPDKPALIAYRADRAKPLRLSYRELGECVARAAGALRALGVGQGDVVGVQLPNWSEFVISILACGRLGAIANPLMPIFRARELGYMLGFAEAKVLIVPKVFRGFDHAAMAAELKAELPKLRHVITVDGDGDDSFGRMLLADGERAVPAPERAQSALKPDQVAVLMFTSGTTGSPKGVMHTSNALVACTYALAGRFGLSENDVLHVCSPMGHMTGYAAVMLVAIRLGATAVLQDIWEPMHAVTIMVDDGVSYVAASTPFLHDLCEAFSCAARRPSALRSFMCGGAPIPPVLVERAARELGVHVCSLWGMTESLGSTLTEPARAAEKSSTSDGRALAGVEVRVVDHHGLPVPVGTTGRLMVRGAQMFAGYYKRPDLVTFDADGWFDSGDLAYMDEEGYIRINGRTKDVLVRGGENIPVFEIEALLCHHPSVASVAIVGYPDARLGERACACVAVRKGTTLDLAAVRVHMETNKVAKQYWPERVQIFDDLPHTPSGKVQKFKLREMVTSAVAKERGA